MVDEIIHAGQATPPPELEKVGASREDIATGLVSGGLLTAEQVAAREAAAKGTPAVPAADAGPNDGIPEGAQPAPQQRRDAPPQPDAEPAEDGAPQESQLALNDFIGDAAVDGSQAIEEDLPETPTDMSNEHAEAFKHMRQQVVDLRKQVKGSAAEPEPDAVKKLQTELSETKQKLGAAQLTSDEDFQEAYDKPIKKKLTQIADVTKAYNADENIIKQAARMGIKERSEYLEEHAPEAASLLALHLADYDLAMKDRTIALQESATTTESLSAIKSERMSEVFDGVVGNLTKAAYCDYNRISFCHQVRAHVRSV